MIIRVRFIKNEQPQGREYSYYANGEIAVGDRVLVGTGQKAVVTGVDVPEEEIELFKDRVKTILGKEARE